MTQSELDMIMGMEVYVLDVGNGIISGYDWDQDVFIVSLTDGGETECSFCEIVILSN